MTIKNIKHTLLLCCMLLLPFWAGAATSIFSVEKDYQLTLKSKEKLIQGLNGKLRLEVLSGAQGWQVFVGDDAVEKYSTDALELIHNILTYNNQDKELAKAAITFGLYVMEKYENGMPTPLTSKMLRSGLANYYDVEVRELEDNESLERFILGNRLHETALEVRMGVWFQPQIKQKGRWRSWRSIQEQIPMDPVTGRLLDHVFTPDGFQLKPQEQQGYSNSRKKEEEARQKAEQAKQKKAEEERKAEEARNAEQQRKDEQAKQKKAEDRRKAEEARNAEQQRKDEEARQKKAEENRKAEEARKAQQKKQNTNKKSAAEQAAEDKRIEEELRKEFEQAREAERKAEEAREAKRSTEQKGAKRGPSTKEERQKRAEEVKAANARKSEQMKKEAEQKAKQANQQNTEKPRKDEQAKKKAEEERKAEEARKAEQRRKDEQAKKKAEEERKAEEARKAEQRRKDEQAKKKAEEERKAEEARKAEQRRKDEQAKQKAEEERKAEEARKAEQRRKDEQAKQKAEEERKAEEARKAEQRRKDEQAKQKAEEERKAEEARKAEQQRKDEQKKAEEAKKKKAKEVRANRHVTIGTVYESNTGLAADVADKVSSNHEEYAQLWNLSHEIHNTVVQNASYKDSKSVSDNSDWNKIAAIHNWLYDGKPPPGNLLGMILNSLTGWYTPPLHPEGHEEWLMMIDANMPITNMCIDPREVIDLLRNDQNTSIIAVQDGIIINSGVMIVRKDNQSRQFFDRLLARKGLKEKLKEEVSPKALFDEVLHSRSYFADSVSLVQPRNAIVNLGTVKHDSCYKIEPDYDQLETVLHDDSMNMWRPGDWIGGPTDVPLIGWTCTAHKKGLPDSTLRYDSLIKMLNQVQRTCPNKK